MHRSLPIGAFRAGLRGVHPIEAVVVLFEGEVLYLIAVSHISVLFGAYEKEVLCSIIVISLLLIG